MNLVRGECVCCPVDEPTQNASILTLFINPTLTVSVKTAQPAQLDEAAINLALSS